MKQFFLSKALIFSIIYFTLYNLTYIYFDHHSFLTINTLSKITWLIPALFILFGVVFILLPRFLALFVNIIFCLIGGAALYFIINFGKVFDVGVIIDALSIEQELIENYFSEWLLVTLIASFALPIIFEIIFTKYNILIPNKVTLSVPLICLIFAISHNFSNKLEYRAMTILDNAPFRHAYIMGRFLIKYRSYIEENKHKIDLTDGNNVSFTSNEPLTVMLIIGESMRGDINSLNGYKEYNNMPLMSLKENLISFANTKSSATSTRLAIPYMLTNATDFEKTTQTQGVTSIFRHLGFKTSWIGNQGLFGYWDVNYAANALESEHIISNREIRIQLNKTKIYDEDLIPYFKDELYNSSKQKFIIVHLIGSHWYFSDRYPESFGHKFKPICNNRSVSRCSTEELINSYHNTILYSDYVLDLILNELKDKNALVIYASDHGLSLNENGIFGNAYSGDNVPKEQLSIAMFAWMSDKFKKTHKQNYKNIVKNKDNDISHHHIFHSLLDCAGVEADFIDKNLSICN